MNGVNIKNTNEIHLYKNGQIWIVFFLFLFPFFFFITIFIRDVNINAGDGIGYEVALRFVKQVLQEGELPLWNKYVAMGTSNIGDIQQKILYPFTWICALLPIGIMFKFFYVLHISLANVFAYNFCQAVKCNKLISIFGAFVFSFSNLLIIRYEHLNILCCFVWIPLIFSFIIKYSETANYKYLILSAFAMTFQFMSGFPQTAFYCDIFVFITMLYLNLKQKKGLAKYLIDSIKLGMMYLALCMAQILPLYELMKFSGRDEISYEYFSEGAANLLLLFDLFDPKMTGDFGSLLHGAQEFPTDTYLGMIPLVLLFYGLIYATKRKPVIKYLTIYSCGAIIFSCACNNFPALGRIIYTLPIIGSFRTTTRMLAFGIIPLMAIVIISFKDIIDNRKWKDFLNINATLAIVLLVLFVTVKVLDIVYENDILDYYSKNNIGLKSFILLVIVYGAVFVYSRGWIHYKHIEVVLFIFLVFLQISDVYFINKDSSADVWRTPYMLKARTYSETWDSDTGMLNALLRNNANNTNRIFTDLFTWEELANTPWSIRPNCNILTRQPMIQSYITFNNPMLLKLTNTTYGMMMNTDELKINSNLSLASLLNIGFIIQRKGQKPIGNSEYVGIVYEEYLGRQMIHNEMFALGEHEQNAYIIIAIDATVHENGSKVYLCENGEVITQLDMLSSNRQYYGYNFITDQKYENLSLLIENGENVVLNGFRVEKYLIVPFPELKNIYSGESFSIIRNQNAPGQVFFIENVKAIENVEDYILENKDIIPFCSEAYIDTKDGFTGEWAGKGVVYGHIEKNNSVIADVDVLTDKALLVFSESYYPGWKAYIDDKHTTVYKIDGLLQGIIVSKGEHNIIFKYEPDSLMIGGLITFITIIVLGALLLFKKGEKDECCSISSNA